MISKFSHGFPVIPYLLSQTISRLIFTFQTTNLTICLMTSKFQMQAVIRQFLSILGIDSSQILDIYQLYLHKLPIKQYQQIIRSCTAPLDGMIFGISHGQAGILEELLPGNVLNFCSSSQDIYFNTKILSALTEESYNAICHTKYIIFDMFDYTYFNFDTILTNEFQNYLTANGFFCENRHDYHHSQSVDDINHCLTEIFALRSDTSAFQRFLTLFPQIHCPDVREYHNEYRKLMRPDTTLHQDAIAAYLSPSTPVFHPFNGMCMNQPSSFRLQILQSFSTWYTASILISRSLVFCCQNIML